jgi:uncharacterized protein (TIGR03084 family)
MARAIMPGPSPSDLAADLAAEHEALDVLVADLAVEEWVRPTPADGWSVADSVSHLTYFDATASLALTDPLAFAEHAATREDGSDVTLGRSVPGPELLATWREGRAALLAAIGRADPAARVPWYGPSMSLASFVTARLMETWAHGADVADALGRDLVVTDRLRHVVHIGVRARPYAFMVHGVQDPGTAVAVVATAPDGSEWSWTSGSDETGSVAETLRGPARDLALVFTQRRHPSDTAVVAEGPTAGQWLRIAQAFAGPAGPGRAPRGRS